MNVLVCVSRVPDTATRIAVASSGKAIDTNAVKYILNPYDEFAIEEGLRLVEKNGGEVTVITVGTEANIEVLRNALAMGAEKAILVKTANDEFDSYFVANSIANVVKELNPEIVLLGRQSIDYDSYQITSLVGELADLPSISVVSKLDINGNNVTAERDIEGGKEVLETTLPCVISVQKGINEPRFPKLPQIMKAKQKPIDTRDGGSTSNLVEIVGMDIPSKARVGKILGDSDVDIQELVRLLREEAKVI
jgi:electron transfer flavoprotein beta subunit